MTVRAAHSDDTPAIDRAADLRAALAEQLRADAKIINPAVEAAFRTVARERWCVSPPNPSPRTVVVPCSCSAHQAAVGGRVSSRMGKVAIRRAQIGRDLQPTAVGSRRPLTLVNMSATEVEASYDDSGCRGPSPSASPITATTSASSPR
ncbi:hypothetical protein Vau01_066500 [Virgisporangium aurantiacum]|uniref:Uncharacterized protein n=1 Tax=Virgisporangium aurantiacum TaxID=175570 RepID=A0A8J3Z7Z6_9ACTN|nr:hypothetical protein Vau01_066500 [Virgisporangium aurantiacum]